MTEAAKPGVAAEATKAKPAASPKKGGKQVATNQTPPQPSVVTAPANGKRVVKLESGITVTYN